MDFSAENEQKSLVFRCFCANLQMGIFCNRTRNHTHFSGILRLTQRLGGSMFTKITSSPNTSILLNGMIISSLRPSSPKNRERPGIITVSSRPVDVLISNSPMSPRREPSVMQITARLPVQSYFCPLALFAFFAFTLLLLFYLAD